MGTIWKEELYKIASRKIVWLGVFLLLAFVTIRLYGECCHYTTTIDGNTYQGRAAIRKDKELTRRCAGLLTKEKVSRLYKEYGFFYYDRKTDTAVGNYCNRFITENFTNFRQTDGYSPDEIHFLKGEEWKRNAAYLLENDVRFDYVYGWNDFTEMYVFTIVALFIILILGLSPVFAEEYQLKTADILRTTRRGKGSGIWLKILAALSFSIALTCGVCAYLWLIYLAVYGAQGWDASSILLSFVTPYGYCPESILGYFIYITSLSLVGVLLLTGIVIGISALCKSPFLVLILSLCAYLFPVVWVQILGPMWLFGVTMTKNITHFMTSMPVYLPMGSGFAFSAEQIMVHLGIALAVGIGGICLGYHRYRNC